MLALLRSSAPLPVGVGPRLWTAPYMPCFLAQPTLKRPQHVWSHRCTYVMMDTAKPGHEALLSNVVWPSVALCMAEFKHMGTTYSTHETSTDADLTKDKDSVALTMIACVHEDVITTCVPNAVLHLQSTNIHAPTGEARWRQQRIFVSANRKRTRTGEAQRDPSQQRRRGTWGARPPPSLTPSASARPCPPCSMGAHA